MFNKCIGSSDDKESTCMRETWVWALSWENPLEKETDTHSSILAWRIPWTEEPGLENSTERGARMLAPWKKSYDQPREHLRKQRHHFANKGTYSQSYGFSSSHVWMWESDHKEGWTLKNWCFWTMVLEKTPEIPWDSKEIKPVNPKENQPWIFIERTDAEAEAPILWPPDAKSQLIRKDLDSGKD